MGYDDVESMETKVGGQQDLEQADAPLGGEWGYVVKCLNTLC